MFLAHKADGIPQQFNIAFHDGESQTRALCFSSIPGPEKLIKQMLLFILRDPDTLRSVNRKAKQKSPEIKGL